MAVSLEKKAKMIECTPVHIKDEEIPLSKIEIQVKPAISKPVVVKETTDEQLQHSMKYIEDNLYKASPAVRKQIAKDLKCAIKDEKSRNRKEITTISLRSLILTGISCLVFSLWYLFAPDIHTCLSEDVYNSVRGIMDFIAVALAIGVLASILRDGIEG